MVTPAFDVHDPEMATSLPLTDMSSRQVIVLGGLGHVLLVLVKSSVHCPISALVFRSTVGVDGFDGAHDRSDPPPPPPLLPQPIKQTRETSTIKHLILPPLVMCAAYSNSFEHLLQVQIQNVGQKVRFFTLIKNVRRSKTKRLKIREICGLRAGMNKRPIGIIGGSGLYQMEGVKIEDEATVETPFGAPSDKIMLGKLSGCDVAFLPRHGRGHKILPHEINYRANIFALKVLGIEDIISVSAVGSMKEDIRPGHLVIVDQFVDRTKCRPETFFGNGLVAHVSFADPVCARLKKLAFDAAQKTSATVHNGGTYVCIDGPMFSSRAESNIYRSWGVDVIGMTNLQEAKLAREAEICYTTIALVTDYDCWYAEEGPVDVAMIIKTMQENVKRAQETICAMLPTIGIGESCTCRSALKSAIMTEEKVISNDVKKRLSPIIGKYLARISHQFP